MSDTVVRIKKTVHKSTSKFVDLKEFAQALGVGPLGGGDTETHLTYFDEMGHKRSICLEEISGVEVTQESCHEVEEVPEDRKVLAALVDLALFGAGVSLVCFDPEVSVDTCGRKECKGRGCAFAKKLVNDFTKKEGL